jgi:hypothetical protein
MAEARGITSEMGAVMQWEYLDRMVMFQESSEGMVSGLDTWINGAGAEGWELASTVPLIAPNKDGIAYGTIGVHLVFKRPLNSSGK